MDFLALCHHKPEACIIACSCSPRASSALHRLFMKITYQIDPAPLISRNSAELVTVIYIYYFTAGTDPVSKSSARALWLRSGARSGRSSGGVVSLLTERYVSFRQILVKLRSDIRFWVAFTGTSHLPPPLPGFSAEASEDIRCIARLLEDVDQLVLDTLVAEKDVSGEIITELKSKVHEHSDADLWAYFADGGQYQWKMAFDVLLLLLGTSAGTNSYAYGRGKVKAFEFALALPDMVDKAQESCQLPPVVRYRLLMKADTLHSFLDTAETTLRDRYLYELNKRNNTTSDR